MIQTYCIYCINYQITTQGAQYGFDIPNCYQKKLKYMICLLRLM